MSPFLLPTQLRWFGTKAANDNVVVAYHRHSLNRSGYSRACIVLSHPAATRLENRVVALSIACD